MKRRTLWPSSSPSCSASSWRRSPPPRSRRHSGPCLPSKTCWCLSATLCKRSSSSPSITPTTNPLPSPHAWISRRALSQLFDPNQYSQPGQLPDDVARGSGDGIPWPEVPSLCGRNRPSPQLARWGLQKPTTPGSLEGFQPSVLRLGSKCLLAGGNRRLTQIFFEKHQ